MNWVAVCECSCNLRCKKVRTSLVYALAGDRATVSAGEAVSSEKVHPASSLNDSPQRMIVLKVREPLDSLDVIYGINPIVLPPNFSQEYPVHRIYKPSLPLYKRTQ